MSAKTKLIVFGGVAGAIGIALLAINWSLLSGSEGRLWEASGTPDTAKMYVSWADELEYQSATQWRMMRLVPSMRAHLAQRRSEAAAHEAALPKPVKLTDAERRKKIRTDYENDVRNQHLPPGMAAAMLALIDEANARNGGIYFSLTVQKTVQPGDDSVLELALKDGTVPAFDPAQGCAWDVRRDAERIDITNLGDDKTGIFVTITLKDVPEPLILNETGGGVSSERRARRLGATVAVKVVPPAGSTVEATREVSLAGFAISKKVRQGQSISTYSIYTEELKTLAGNSCFSVCALLGTRDPE